MIRTLRGWAGFWITVAMAVGVISAGMWLSSTRAWDDHLARAAQTGRDIAAAVLLAAPRPDETRLVAIGPVTSDAPPPGYEDAGLPASARITALAFRQSGPDGAGQSGGVRLQVQVVSASLQYPVSQLGADAGAYGGMAALSRMMAQLCSDPVVFLRAENGPWWRVESALWSCDAQPRDLRLWALLLAGLTLMALFSHAADVTAGFRDLARKLSARSRPGQTDDLAPAGPEELRATIRAVNGYLAEERATLARRAIVLSGVSHDLGTPATRLRLRAALIEDAPLRQKFEADLDRMAEMIEEVLTFTRTEIAAEAERDFSLTALVEAVVDDFQDTGQPVSLVPQAPVSMESAGTVFGTGRKRRVTLPEGRRLLLRGRPLALERALSNLIENAMKYGRRAQVALLTTSTHVVIEVQDAGRDLSPEKLRQLTDPFQRGPNLTAADGAPVSGFGMGLSIVATIAAQHGGALEFEQRSTGLCARLILPRG
ncbi:sensor histidine kinase [Roseicitreum antarcticum]|uniref:histidine kinase n=1 Tax=Roseicitreum antarcticum TaxID=564137 RepID=A0A1H2VIX0_9RHOB|nr:HAMP domain-containing sensor histidine kinase [Roseicitreum antarcticum]SDW68233.1 Signal transduction histidine kinase [Roseicitreum antarcticum]